ncbi:MAG: photosystem I reaction center subunit IV [Oleispira antarctica]|nr:photosystem I reaction center subunit IV [Oleispira antarctica]MBQ0793913.1 photosystem I reaction center subunit IV [Oleispira antarctica]
MRFHSIRNRIVTAVPQLSMIKVTMLVAGLLSSVFAQAQWQDPLESPALATDRAHKSLLLDITRIGSRLVAVGAHGHVVYSDDSGQSWSQAQTPSSVTLTAVYFPNATMGWAVGHDGLILHSSDAGETWVKQFDGYLANSAIVKGARENKELAITELDNAKNSADLSDIDNAEVHLENATYALEDAQYDQNTGSTKPFLDVWFYDAKIGFAVGAYGMAFRTRDGGKSWRDWSSRLDNGDRLHINGVTMVGPRSLMLVGERGLILRSDDMGENWRALPSPYEGSFFGIMAKDDNVLIFGLRGNLYHSVDGGIQWQKVHTGSEQTLMAGVSKADRTSVMVGNGGSVILLNRRSEEPKSIILPGRTTSASVTQAPDGTLVIVGEAGVERIDVNGSVIKESITMAKGGF